MDNNGSISNNINKKIREGASSDIDPTTNTTITITFTFITITITITIVTINFKTGTTSVIDTITSATGVGVLEFKFANKRRIRETPIQILNTNFTNRSWI